MRYFLCLVVSLTALPTPILAQSTDPWGGAKWVWDEPDANKTDQSNDPRYLRLPFVLGAKPQAAELWITADNLYTAYVNGQKVGSGSEWSSPGRYDVAKHLVAGKNVLAIQATNQGGPAGAIARLQIKTGNKEQASPRPAAELFIVTDEKTKITQKAGPDWLRTDLDDSAWFNAVVLGDASIAPWNLAGGPVGKKGGKGGGDRFGYGFNTVDPTIKKQISAQEQLKHFVVPKDFEIELVAADPVIINPVTMTLDDQGRIILSESHTYRYGPPGSPIKPFANPVIRLDPDGKGGFTRTLIADGFDDPVMGIAVKGDKLWLTANNYLYTYDLPPSPSRRGAGGEGGGDKSKGTSPSPPAPLPGGEGSQKPLATNKKILLQDKNKAWNPFGMFVLEWGPDGKLYMSVGNHSINIVNNKGESLSARGSSGMIMRMNPDGTKMERLVHGLRVPYSFEMDPFGQLWLLSNGEGNPDRFVRVIEGVDYHCYSRGNVDNEWLADRHPLAPPCEEVHGGAHTQLMRYYAANFPKEYQGNLFCCNWGRHGFAGANRGIFRFVLDERNNVVKKDTLVACTDPHFRPSHIHLDTDGSLLIADWYGRDDESDKTGRIWRLKYVGKDKPVVKHKLDAPEWKNDDYAIEALGSPSHLVRENAMEEVLKRGNQVAKKLGTYAAKSEEPLGAANAIWALVRLAGAEARREADEGARNADWRVQRLAVSLLRRSDLAEKEVLDRTNKIRFGPKMSAEVALESALLMATHPGRLTHADILRLALTAPSKSIVDDPHLRYEAAWHLAKSAAQEDFANLLNSENANVRLAGLIAIDVACYENTPAKKAALAALSKALENPGKLDQQLLLTVAQLDGDASIIPGLEKLLSRDDLPTATVAKAVLVLKAKSGGSLASAKLSAAAGKRLIEAVEKGQLKIASPADQLVIFEFLESEGPTPFALKQISSQLQSNNKELRLAAHTLARRFGDKADSLAANLWPSVLNPKTKFEDAIESLSTIARVEKSPKADAWARMLDHENRFVRMETVRWWRQFIPPYSNKPNPYMPQLLKEKKDALVKMDADLADDIQAALNPSAERLNKDDLTKYALKEIAAMPASDRPKRAAMGQQVFERNACTKCHTTATQTTLLAPSLKGVAQQKVEYLIESVLYPSKIIKTGWEVENIELKNGKTLIGLVKDEGKSLRVLNLDKDERVVKTDIESRTVSKISVMPEGQEASLSRREFVDLIAYLQTLK